MNPTLTHIQKGADTDMGKTYEQIDEKLAAWIEAQKMFFVATAPLSDSGLINCSPRGGDSFRILGGREVAWQDFTGSGVETIAHLKENGRIVIMFCAFEGSPLIVRLHGRGEVIEAGHADFNALASRFPEHPGTRAVIRVSLERISDSCGYAVPLYEFQEDRRVLDKWSENKGREKIVEYQRQNNSTSIDGLPGLAVDN